VRKYGYSYDYVFVFKVYVENEINSLNEMQQMYTMKNILDRCQSALIETKCFYSCQRDEIYVKMRIHPSRLKLEADRIDYKLLLDPRNLKDTAKAGYVTKDRNKSVVVWKPINITDEYNVSPYDPYEFIYGKYDTSDQLQHLYTKYPAKLNRVHPFREVDRIRLLLSILEGKIHENPPGCGLDLQSLEINKVVLAHFPLHNYEELVNIEKEMLKVVVNWNDGIQIPLNRIKDYFGERIGLYFVYLQFYTQQLMLPALIGTVVFIVSVIYQSNEGIMNPYFAAYSPVWSMIFMKGWQQRQSATAMKWGAAGFEKEEKVRPQFQGIETTSPIDGSYMKYSTENKALIVLVIWMVILVFIALDIGVVIGLIFLESYLSQGSVESSFALENKSFSSFVTATVLTVCVSVLSDAFFMVAVYLNDFENYRTDTEYENNLVLKVSVFCIFNAYTYLTFIAFVKPFMNYSCVMGSCYEELSNTLLVLLSYSLFAGVFKEIFLRMVQQYYKYRKEASSIEPGKVMGVIEEQYILSDYRALEGTFQEYSAIVVRYGYATLFVAAFPVAPLITLVTSFLQIRIDCWKLCTVFRRPIPKNAEDIGIWEDALNAVSILAIGYNFGLIFLTAHYLIDTTWETRWVYFMCSEHLMFFVVILIAVSVNRVPTEVQMQLERQTFLVEKVIGNAADEAEEEFIVEEKTHNITIAETDNDWEFPIDEEDEDEHIVAGGVDEEHKSSAVGGKYAHVHDESTSFDDDFH